MLYLFSKLDIGSLTIIVFSCFIFSFLIIQYGIQNFIYNKVKEIYDKVSLLELSDFQSNAITTDISSLTKDVERYARDKKLEIETLKVREQYRKEFIGNVAHELKTPLFTIQGYLLTLIEGAMSDDIVLEKYLKRAAKGVDRLTYIVDDLDMISRLEVGDLNLKISTYNIVESIQNVFDLLEMKATKKDISLIFEKEYTQPMLVTADDEKIKQVITNLIVNSIKYGNEKGTTEVSIEDLKNGKYLIRITDNGIGIDDENLPRLFERFYRVSKSRSRDEGGSGLGLSIVKHIIEAHNQRIYIESELGVGSEFSFTIEKASS